MGLLGFFSTSPDAAPLADAREIKRRYTRLRWSVFLSATFGYGIYYVCRQSLNVIKMPLVEAGVLSEGELGIIGSALLATYAVGKLTNGFLADRSNIRRFLAAGLLVSALINLALGFTAAFGVFLVLWAVNGWAQSMGAAPCVVALSRWFGNRERGTFYGLWSSSHNLGEALAYLLTAVIVSAYGWQWSLRGAGLLGIIGFVLILIFMRDTPQNCGLPSVAAYRNDPEADEQKSVAGYQRDVLRNPAIWMLALSSAFMYISRYAVNSWGVFFLEADKGFTNMEACGIVATGSVCGIVGTVASGWVSDFFFAGRRNVPALLFGMMNVLGLALFLFGPERNFAVAIASMIVFGLAIGALICYLGGLMAVDIAPKKASGAALGIVGIASYVGAALQDLVSGFVIQGGRNTADGYDFSAVVWFWLGAALLSILCALSVWNARAKEN